MPGPCECRLFVLHFDQVQRLQLFQVRWIEGEDNFHRLAPMSRRGPTQLDPSWRSSRLNGSLSSVIFERASCATDEPKRLASISFLARRATSATLLTRGTDMSDEHQVNSIIATAIVDARKDHPEGRIDPEAAKHVAKCIIEALSNAGLRIGPVSQD